VSLSAGSQLGAYEILALLGEGGMGQVFRARDARLDRDVAIKVLPAPLANDPVARERLRREAVAAARIDHPFICKVFEIGEADGRFFIVMELVGGETLHARLAAGPVPIATSLSWAVEMAEALETAHARQIVHRDLKPANVMVTAQGHIKVMDFGLAKDVSIHAPQGAEMPTVAALTDRGTRVGTPAYMAPEQIVGDPIDARSDIFSLGVLLAEVASGVHPFRRDTIAAMTSAILAEPAIITSSRTEIPASLRQVLQRLLAKAPADRYQSMADVRRDLAALSSASMPASSELGGARWAASDRIGQVRRWPLVGREAEQAELRDRLSEATEGHGRFVLLGGEPGVGKTRLTEAVLEAARARGCMSLVGHAYEMEGVAPYVPFVEMLEYSSRVVPPAALRHALGDAAPEVATLMPELRQMFPDIPPPLDVPAEQQRRMLFNGYRDFVARSCALAPIVAVLEDLHWADESTLQLLLHLAPTLSSLPILVIGTYRDVELAVHRPFAKTMETLVRQRFATRMSLKPLPAAGVGALLTAMSGGREAPSSLSRVVFAETDGNPFFVEEVFQHLKEEGRLFDANGEWRLDTRFEALEVPESVRLVIGRRLERLSEGARRVLTTAAVIGRSFSLALLEALERPGADDQVLAALDEAEAADLIAPQRAGREVRYLFTHELIRQTLAEALSMPRRQRLHARTADAIERLYASAVDRHTSALAHHLFHAGAASDPDKTNRYLVMAADEARAASAPEDALRCLDQALSLRDDDRGPTIADLYDRRGRVLRSLGRPIDAIDALTRAIAAWDSTADVNRLVGSAVELISTHGWQVDTASALRVASTVLDKIAGASPVQQFPLEILHAVVLAVTGEASLAVDRFRAIETARAWAGIRPFELLLRSMECHLWWIAADFARARDAARRVVAQYTSPEDLWLVAEISWTAPFGDFALGEPVSEAELTATEALAERIGQLAPLGLLRLFRAYQLADQGDLAGAERAARKNAEFNRAIGNRWGFFSNLVAGWTATLGGRFDDARADFAEAIRNEPASYFRNCSGASEFWALSYISPRDASARWPALAIRPPDVRAINPLGAWVTMTSAVLGLAVLGRRDEAAAFSAAATALAATGVRRLPVAGGPAIETIAGIAAGCARVWDAAEAFFERALVRAETMAMRPEASHARIWYADMLRHRDSPGDRERARVLCDEALSVAASIGAVLYERQAQDVRATL
jgi:tetratricopeptide (TPR) repeat protein